MSDLCCQDCGVDTMPRTGPWEYYMVRDDVWADAGTVDGCLCVGCLERRLGRRLEPDDFSDLPINVIFDSRDSERLTNRKGGDAV